MNVTEITRNATHDDLSDADYLEMYQELRDGRSLDTFVRYIGSQYTKAQWSKYERGLIELNRTMKNELRHAVGRPPLPQTIAEIASAIHADALIARIGQQQADRALLVGSDVKTATIYVNGEFAVVDERPTPRVTPVTSARMQRKRYVRPCIAPELAERCEASGMSFVELLELALARIEEV